MADQATMDNLWKRTAEEAKQRMQIADYRKSLNEYDSSREAGRSMEDRLKMRDAYVNRIENTRLDEARQKRRLALMDKENSGLLNVAERKEVGATRRTGMTTDLGREQLGQTSLEQERRFGLDENKQLIDQNASNRTYKLSQAELDYKKKKDEQDRAALLEQNKVNNLINLTNANKSGFDPLTGQRLNNSMGESAQMLQNYGAQPTEVMTPYDYGKSSTFTPEEIALVNQSNQSTQPTGLAQVGNNQAGNSYSMTQQHTTNRPDKPYYQPAARGAAPQGPGSSNLGTQPISYEDAAVRKRRNLDQNYAGNYGRTF